ncbi:MAG TPA: 50S ribosomal protein L22 [Fibrobacteria bacterium]|nr:50S ribosomal protein L22 [Fibrobacteria bacterium]HOX50057.1 50S ribosomal protein L22 [Fibrobacteria bacterium]
MQALAKSTFVRSSSPKLRIVAKHIRGVDVNQALVTLRALSRRNKGAYLLEKTLSSAVANFQVKNSEGTADVERLKVKTVMIDEGPLMKRIRPHAQGRAFRILKKMSHITVVVSD